MIRLCLFLCMASLTTPALADVEIQYSAGQFEGFAITNLDTCPLENTTVQINLGPSVGGLIMDTVQGPPGLNRAQAFSVMFGEDYLLQVPVVPDGGNKIVLQVQNLPGSETIVLTMDTDHMKLGSGAVALTEHIEGSIVRVGDDDPVRFNAEGMALVPGGDCVA